MNQFFEPISKPLIGMSQMIWRWIIAANPLISHIESFPKLPTVEKQFEKWQNFQNRTSEFVFLLYFNTAHPIDANDMALEILRKCS